MTILEYLQKKYNQQNPHILKVESFIFKIPYPIKIGKSKQHGNKQITQNMAYELIAYFKGLDDPSSRIKFAINILSKILVGKKEIIVQQEKNTTIKQPTQNSVKSFIAKSSIDPKLDSFLNTFEWKAIRKMVLNLHGSKCQCCGISVKDGAVMNVDHIKPRKFYPELALEIDNLQVLCSDCNHGKGNWDMTDSRRSLVIQ